MSYLSKRGAVYYFRRVIPDDLRPILGKLEIMKSLRTKDREEAKRLIPAELIRTDALFAEASKAKAPTAAAHDTMSREEWEFEQRQDEMRSAEFDALDEQAEELDAYEKQLAAEPLGAALLADMKERVSLARIEGAAEGRRIIERAKVAQEQAVEQGTHMTAPSPCSGYMA